MGGAGCGKTTLAAFLEEDSFLIRKTPHMVYRTYTLDTPASYLESPWMRQHLIAAAQDASCVLMLTDAAAARMIYPPGFAKVFRVPVFGIVTRCQKCAQENIRAAEIQLKQAGIKEPFYYIDFTDDACIKTDLYKLRQRLEPYRKLAEIMF